MRHACIRAYIAFSSVSIHAVFQFLVVLVRAQLPCLLSSSGGKLISLRRALIFWGNIMKVKPDRTLDCLGLYCPEPVYRTRMELDDIGIGEILEVLADDPAAEADIRSLVKHLEQEIVNVSKDGNTVRILIKKVK